MRVVSVNGRRKINQRDLSDCALFLTYYLKTKKQNFIPQAMDSQNGFLGEKHAFIKN